MKNCPECNSTELLELDGYYACLDCEWDDLPVLDDTRNKPRLIKSSDDGIAQQLIINPSLIEISEVSESDIRLLRAWCSVRDSVRDVVWASVVNENQVGLWCKMWEVLRAKFNGSIWDALRTCGVDAPKESIRDAIWGYVGGLLNTGDTYPFQCLVDLWCKGFLPIFDGSTWWLVVGEPAEIVYRLPDNEFIFIPHPGAQHEMWARVMSPNRIMWLGGTA